MKKKPMRLTRLSCAISSLFILYSFSSNSFALPFSIVPAVPLPTTVTQGGTASASYTITNLTNATLTNNIIKTPPNLTSNGCSPSLNLAPKASCTLSLTISGAVNKNDPNTANHLFVCLKDRTTCAGPTPENSLNVTVTGVTSLLVAVGTYSTLTDGLPLIYTSNDHGITWSNPILPEGLTANTLTTKRGGGTNKALLAVACSSNGNSCAAIGVDTGNNELLGYTSTNRGSSWTSAQFTSLPTGTDIKLNGLTCDSSGTQCVAVGNYDPGSGNVGLSYTSANGGATWTLSPTLPPTTLKHVSMIGRGGSDTFVLNSVACSSDGLKCNAVGTKNQGIPVVYNTNDGGLSWSSPNPLTVPVTLIVDNATKTDGSAELNSVACNADGQRCTTVGIQNDNQPIAYHTTDGGTNWSGVLLAQPTPLRKAPSNLPVTLNGIACSADGLKCIAAGYVDDASDKKPIIYTSQNGGSSWSSFIYLPRPTGSTMTELIGITCDSTGLLCTTIGIADTPIVVSYTTTDGGNNWQGPVQLTSPASITKILLFGVSGSK